MSRNLNLAAGDGSYFPGTVRMYSTVLSVGFGSPRCTFHKCKPWLIARCPIMLLFIFSQFANLFAFFISAQRAQVKDNDFECKTPLRVYVHLRVGAQNMRGIPVDKCVLFL